MALVMAAKAEAPRLNPVADAEGTRINLIYTEGRNLSLGSEAMTTEKPYYYIGRTNVGYPTVREDLKKVDDDQLIAEYKNNMKSVFGQLFGHNAKKWQNMIADELLSRGITSVPNIIFPIKVENNW
jgi:hypothetical protein